MDAVHQHSPVILLLGPHDGEKFDLWLERSPYSTHQVADPFQALEQISDFTVRKRPDVIFMHVDSVADGMLFIQTIVDTDSAQVPIIAAGADDGSDEDRLDALAAQLFRLIPHGNAV